MSRQELIRIVSKDDKGVSEVRRSALPALYRKILFELGINSDTLLAQLERWIHDPVSHVKQTPKKRTEARGNYIKKIIEPEKMTWKSFMDLIGMLYPEYMKITVEFQWPRKDREGRPFVSTHSVTVPHSGLTSDVPCVLGTDLERLAILDRYNPAYECDEEDDDNDPFDHANQYNLAFPEVELDVNGKPIYEEDQYVSEEDIYGNPIEGRTQGDFEEDDDDDY